MHKAIYALIGVLSAASIYANAAVGDIKTTYTITQSQAESKTTVKNDGSKENLTRGYLMDALKKAFLNSPYITSIQETKGTETKEEYQGIDYATMTKKSNIFVDVALPEKVSMLFEVEQRYQACKKQPGSNADAAGCYLTSTATIRGPVAVYGNYASPVDVSTLMQNKQDLVFELSRSYDGTELYMISRFNIASNNFEERLMKFMEVFNVPVPVAGDIGVGSKKSGPQLLTRQRMLVGIARYLRQGSERMMQ